MKKDFAAIDLFCGAGGLTCGLMQSGIQVYCGIDIDPACKYPYEVNNRKSTFILKSVAEITKEDLLPYFKNKKYKLLAGCAPCQTFSRYNPKASNEDERWNLLTHFQRLASSIKPEFITMENVPNLENQGVFKRFVQSLKHNGYKVSYRVVDCSNYGLPQHRCRLVLLASLLHYIELLPPEKCNVKKCNVENAIKSLPPIEAGEVCKTDRLHVSPSLTPINLQRIIASTPGGTWRDWPPELRLSCHSKKSGLTYPSVYGRMCWNEPSPTLTTQFYGYGNGRFGHPEQNRAISLREGAILQGFPIDYQFVPPDSPIITKVVGRMIGNAVPVTLGKIIGQSFIYHVKKNSQR